MLCMNLGSLECVQKGTPSVVLIKFVTRHKRNTSGFKWFRIIKNAIITSIEVCVEYCRNYLNKLLTVCMKNRVTR